MFLTKNYSKNLTKINLQPRHVHVLIQKFTFSNYVQFHLDIIIANLLCALFNIVKY